MADYIETFYNPALRHSSLNYLTPDEHEALHSKEAQGRILRRSGPPNGVKPTWSGPTWSGRRDSNPRPSPWQSVEVNPSTCRIPA